MAPNLDAAHVYDAIVVGSGAGGRTFASRLADAGRDVLVLDVGPYLFPTHVANLPRRLRIGQFDKHVWGLWPDFKIINYINAEGSQFAGGQGFNLGGRSIFWGGLIPRLSAWELAPWPTPVRECLLASGYADAETAVNKTALSDAPYQDQSRQFLQQILGPDLLVSDAPVAVQYRGFTNLSLAGGMWSSADLLLEDRLLDASKAAPGWKRNSPTINLNHAVWNVTLDPTDARRVTGVRCRDLLAGETRSYQAKNVVLTAGTLESAKIALNFGLADPSGLAGNGITDHEIRYVHFTLPPGSPYTSSTSDPNFQSARLIAEHAAADPDHPFLIGLELGAEFNQGRYIDPGDLTEEVRTHQDWLLCEMRRSRRSAHRGRSAFGAQRRRHRQHEPDRGEPARPTRCATGDHREQRTCAAPGGARRCRARGGNAAHGHRRSARSGDQRPRLPRLRQPLRLRQLRVPHLARRQPDPHTDRARATTRGTHRRQSAVIGPTAQPADPLSRWSARHRLA